ncbi:MAG: tetratricopeptide repeat protein [Candidatus Krumholzibacteriota bacterium]|nr:tetratricopeptide repeat protein [Candidatus Krumholzibacteriota bacterium]
MKICPLITQASILEGPDRELLVREADDHDLNTEVEETEREDSGDDIFMNPDSDQASLAEEESGSLQQEKSVRFLAKSFRGQVNCLGESCRFHDDEKNECRFEILLSGEKAEDQRYEEIESIRSEIERSWDFQKQSTSDILSMFRQMEEKTDLMRDDLSGSINEKLAQIKSMISEVNEENKIIIESIADTLAEKTGEIEDTLKSNEGSLASFKDEVSSWKENIDRNISTMEETLDENRRLVGEVTQNNTEILKVIENQKSTLDEEERRRHLAEARRLNNAGVMSYHNGQYEQALDLFKKAVEIDDSFTEAYNNLGLTYTETSQEEKATESFKKAIELNPELSATYNNLGYVFYRMGSFVEAIEMYNEAIGRSSDSSSAWTNLGNAYYKLDRTDEALDAWNKAIEIDPTNEKAKRNLKRFHAEVSESE